MLCFEKKVQLIIAHCTVEINFELHVLFSHFQLEAVSMLWMFFQFSRLCNHFEDLVIFVFTVELV